MERPLMDVSLASLLVFLHVASGFVLVAGLIGRWVNLGRAKRTEDMTEVIALLAATSPFEKMIVGGFGTVLVAGLLAMWAQGRPFFEDGGYWLITSLALYASVMPLVPLVFIPRGRRFEAALEEARNRNEVTPELAEAFRDRAVAFARSYEAVVVGVIIALMVLKPF